MPKRVAFEKRLRLPPKTPITLTEAELCLRYTPAAVARDVPKERGAELRGAFRRLQTLLRAGFLARPAGPDKTATLSLVRTSEDTLRLRYRGRGAHANLLVIAQRLFVGYHQSPDYVIDAVRNGEAGSEGYTAFVFSVLVKELSVDGLVGPPRAKRVATPSPAAALSEDPCDLRGVRMPKGKIIDLDERVIKGSWKAASARLEDAWLSISGLDGFLPVGHDPEFEPGDEELYVADKGSALELSSWSVEAFFFREWLALLQRPPARAEG